MAIGTFETTELCFRVDVLKEVLESVRIDHYRDIVPLCFSVEMIEIKGAEGLRRHLPLACLAAPDSHLNSLHMATLLRNRWVFRDAPL